jgi:hypothetical protein
MVRPGRRLLRARSWDDRSDQMLRYATSRTASPSVAILSRLDGATPPGAGAVWDAVAYGSSAGVALVVLSTSDGPLDLLWARIAVVGYGSGALAAWLLHRRGVGIRGRAILAATVFAAVAVVPTILHADARVESATPMKSDVLVVEQAAGALLDGRNPYAVVHDDGALATWPAWAQEHFPYLAVVLAIGVPRAVADPAPWTDPRLVYLALGLVIAVPSILRSGLSVEPRLRAFQVLFVLVTGAPLVFTSGKEILVIGLLLASLVAFDRNHAFASGIILGAAVAMHQLAWIVLPVLAFTRPGTHGRRAATVAASIAIAAVVPFLVWNAAAFIEDAVLFPLGFGQPDSTSALTPGGVIASVMPGSRWVLIILIGLALVAGGVLAIRRDVRTASDVARWAGFLLLIALVLAPRVRLAYFALPANLLLWSRLLHVRDEAVGTDPPRARRHALRTPITPATLPRRPSRRRPAARPHWVPQGPARR